MSFWSWLFGWNDGLAEQARSLPHENQPAPGPCRDEMWLAHGREQANEYRDAIQKARQLEINERIELLRQSETTITPAEIPAKVVEVFVKAADLTPVEGTIFDRHARKD